MTDELRADAERRILALLRDWFDRADEDFPDGWEIGDFMLVYEVYEEHADDVNLKPWWGGPTGGRPRFVSVSTTNSTWLQDESMLREALRSVRRRRFDAETESEDDREEDDS